jgi:hypothetical protein
MGAFMTAMPDIKMLKLVWSLYCINQDHNLWRDINE